MAKTVSLKEAQATYSLSVDKADLEQGPIILEHEGTCGSHRQHRRLSTAGS
jgi:hypothetical protein